MTARKTTYYRQQGLNVEGKQRLLPTWSKSEAGRDFIFNRLDPLAVKLGVHLETLRGWYHECLLRGVHLTYVDQHSEKAHDAYLASLDTAAAALAGEALQQRWRELAAREEVRRERQLGTSLQNTPDATLRVLFLQVHSGELGRWWPRFVAESTADVPPGPLVASMLRSMYGVYQLATAYDYAEWLAPQRSFVPSFDVPPAVEITGHTQLSLLTALYKGYKPLPWEQASPRTRTSPRDKEQKAIKDLAALRLRMEDRIVRHRTKHSSDNPADGGA